MPFKLVRFSLFPIALLCLASCATPPPAKVVSRAEIVELDNKMGSELAAQFESQVQLRNDGEVTVFLRKVAQRLSDSSPELKSSSVGVLILRDGADKARNWANFGVPGNRIYLSAGVVRQLEFENEVAALIAYELGHIQKRYLMQRLQAAQGPLDNRTEFFGANSVFVFTEEQELQTAEAAVELLYRAGYDPRGLMGVWNTYASYPGRSPFETSTLQKLMERTRRSISGYAPLLNPIVRSAGFIAIQKRIKKL